MIRGRSENKVSDSSRPGSNESNAESQKIADQFEINNILIMGQTEIPSNLVSSRVALNGPQFDIDGEDIEMQRV